MLVYQMVIPQEIIDRRVFFRAACDGHEGLAAAPQLRYPGAPASALPRQVGRQMSDVGRIRRWAEVGQISNIYSTEMYRTLMMYIIL